MSRIAAINAETLDEMDARHASERRALIDTLTANAYRRGVWAQDCPDVPEAGIIRIHQQVARERGVTFDDLQRKTQQTYISYSRFQVYYAAYKNGFTIAEIAQYFGQHHTSIRNGIKRHGAKVGVDLLP